MDFFKTVKNLDKIKFTGILFLLFSFFLLLFYFYPSNWILSDLINNIYANLFAEFLSISITILLINYLYDLKSYHNLKSRLIRELGSEDKGFTSRAVKELREMGWHSDGSLKNCDLTYANLSKLNLSDFDFTGVTLIEANLQDSNLKNAKLISADLTQTNLMNANLENANLTNAKLIDCNLYNTVLSKAIFNNSDFLNSNLERAELIEVKIINSKFETVNFRFVNFSRSIIQNSNLYGADVSGMDIQNSKFERCNLNLIKNWEYFSNRETASFLGNLNSPIKD